MSNQLKPAFQVKAVPSAPESRRAILVTLSLIGMLLLVWTAVQVA